MGFMGLGAPEMLIIAVIALVIFGPNRLPDVAGQIGKVVRDIRRMTSELTSELEKNADLKDIKDAVKKELGGIQSQVNSASAAVTKEFNSATSVVHASTNSSVTSATSTTIAANSTNSTNGIVSSVEASKVATKLDPFADVTFFEIPEDKPAESADASKISSNSSPKSAPELSPLPQMDAISRARQRRVAAGYNRRVAS